MPYVVQINSLQLLQQFHAAAHVYKYSINVLSLHAAHCA